MSSGIKVRHLIIWRMLNKTPHPTLLKVTLHLSALLVSHSIYIRDVSESSELIGQKRRLEYMLQSDILRLLFFPNQSLNSR